MDDHRTAEGLEHLQTAANELLAAARSFLDVAEDVISDPDRFGGVAAGAVDMLKAFTGRGAQNWGDPPWERHAWDVADREDPSEDGSVTDDSAGVGDVDPAGPVDETPAGAGDDDPAGVAVAEKPAAPATAKPRAAKKKVVVEADPAGADPDEPVAPVKAKPRARAAKKPAATRVKRITVD